MTSFVTQNVFGEDYQDLREHKKSNLPVDRRLCALSGDRRSELLNTNSANYAAASNRDNNFKLCGKPIIGPKEEGREIIGHVLNESFCKISLLTSSRIRIIFRTPSQNLGIDPHVRSQFNE